MNIQLHVLIGEWHLFFEKNWILDALKNWDISSGLKLPAYTLPCTVLYSLLYIHNYVKSFQLEKMWILFTSLQFYILSQL